MTPKSKKSKGIPANDIATWTPYYDEVAFWYQGGRGRWPNSQAVALVFGKIERYWQLQRTSCRVSVERLANELSMSRKTAERCIRVLVQDGLIEDHSPGVRNRPHEYVVTDKVAMVIRAVRAMHLEAGCQYIGERVGDTGSGTEVALGAVAEVAEAALSVGLGDLPR